MTLDLRRLTAKLLVEKTDSGLIQFFRYGFVGGVAFVLDFGTLWALTELAGLHYLVSAALGFAVGLATNYTLSVLWVFSNRKMSNRLHEFAVFALIGVVGVGINELVMWLCTDGLGVHYLGSKIISTVVVYLWNFFMRKKMVF